MTTPGGMSVCSATRRPIRVAFHGRVGCRLEHDGVAGGQRLPELADGDLERVVPRDDGADHADRLLDHLLPAGNPEVLVVGERALPFEFVDVGGGPQQALGQGGVQLGQVGGGHRAPDLGHQLGAELLLLAHDRLVELAQAPLAERTVGGPRRGVERGPGTADGPVHVHRRGVGRLSEHLLGGRVDVVEPSALGGVDQRAVDEEAGLPGRCGGGHIGLLSSVWSDGCWSARRRPGAGCPVRCSPGGPGAAGRRPGTSGCTSLGRPPPGRRPPSSLPFRRVGRLPGPARSSGEYGMHVAGLSAGTTGLHYNWIR